MKILTEIFEKDLGISKEKINKAIKYKVRKATRGIIINSRKQIAIINVARDKYFKLPGGGVENGEDIITALKREILEETGTKITDIVELGIINLYRNQWKEQQIDYGFLAKAVGKILPPHFEEGEIKEGFQLEWVDFDTAIKKIRETQNPKDYSGKFITKRELIFLKKAKEMIN